MIVLRFQAMNDDELSRECERLRSAATDAPRDSQSDAWARLSREYGAALDEIARRKRKRPGDGQGA
jgi:hypothetical protein